MGYKSQLPYTLYFNFASSSMNDSTDYFFGNIVLNLSTITAVQRVYVPMSGIIKAGSIVTYAATTVGTAEDIVMTIRINDTTDYTFATVGLANLARYFTASVLNIPVKNGDFISMKITTPAWATNPDGVRGSGQLLIGCE
jgi:hypothetical protein